MIIEHNEHPIERLMDNAFNKIRGVINADTIIGNPVTTADGVSIIPVSRVTMGFVTGGGEYGEIKPIKKDKDLPFAGGSGAVLSLKPSGFLIDKGTGVQVVSVADDPLSKLAESANNFIKSLKNEEDI